jgi:hypothetical protein
MMAVAGSAGSGRPCLAHASRSMSHLRHAMAGASVRIKVQMSVWARAGAGKARIPASSACRAMIVGMG